MKKIIINADDCGLNTSVNQAIEKCIQQERLTSTTVMACGSDIDGAKRLFNDYKANVSFGCHLTLDEGKPILFEQCMADNGFIISENGEWRFTRKLWSHRLISGALKEAIIRECSAQVELLLDNGFEISHLDSHHHVHTSTGLIWLIPIIGKKYGIKKYRRIRNNIAPSFGLLSRQLWNAIEKLQHRNSLTTDVFCSCSQIFAKENIEIIKEAKSIELMCHPGHPNIKFQNEIEDLLNRDSILTQFDYELINYNQLNDE